MTSTPSHPDEPDRPTPQVSRRGLLRGAGLLGIGAGVGFGATTAAMPTRSPGDQRRRGGFRWLAGDHHVHTQHSRDGMYRVVDQVRHANANGLDWMVIADHGNTTHAGIGTDKAYADIVAARADFKDTLVFHGLEWNVPSAEHGTVFVHPGPDEVAVLREFETAYDGEVRGAQGPGADNEALAVAGVNFLAAAVAQRRVRDALFIVNHPSRRGINSPREMRSWRDAQPHITIGFEGAPGHQPSGIAAPFGLASARGLYDQTATVASFPAYPPESYRTWGGFDWMTATVGGLWDSMLAEGKPWWITASSDAHSVYADTATTGPGSDFTANGRQNDPVYAGFINAWTFDFWPGFYSRTHVGATDFSYAEVMAGLRAGRAWVDHGGLISGLDVRLRSGNRSVTLGGSLATRTGAPVELVITVDLANGPNWAQFVPTLARIDVIRGAVTGPVADAETLVAPDTSVVKSFEVNRGTGTVSFTYDLGPVDRPCYVRLRGTDGRRSAPGFRGAAVDPAGPAVDVVGSADPWADLWFYTNPMWVKPR
jgi:hypothetical protein